MDKNFPSFTVYCKVGVIGMAEEVNETLEIKFDPKLSEEENMELLALKAKIAQGRLGLALAEMMMEHFPGFLEAKAKEEGWDLE